MEKEVIFLCMIHIATGSLPKTAYRVDACPEANNITAWKEASLRLNCSEYSETYSEEVIIGKKLYYCLASNFLNETIEFCGPNAAIERGQCPIYNYAYGATTATSNSCKHFSKGCPEPELSPYHSSSFFKYKACWDINKEFQCFYAEPDCPQRGDKRFMTTSSDLETSTCKDGNMERPNADVIVLGTIVLCLTGVVIGLLLYFFKYKKKPKEKMDTLLRDENDDSSDNNIEVDPGEHIGNPLENLEMETHHKGFEVISGINQPQNENKSDSSDDSGVEQCDDNVGKQIELFKNMRKGASIWFFNSFMEKLKEAMTPDVLKNIICLLQERPENGEIDVTKIGNAEELLHYLNGKYFLSENVCFLQGLFLASEAPTLYQICLEYAKNEDKKVIFFEKKILDKDHTKVQYSINVPNVSSYPKPSLEDLRASIVMLLRAKYDDVIVSGVKNGSVIVTFMIRNYLVPCLKELLKSEESIICQKMKEMKIFKVVIQDDIVYIRDRDKDRIKFESRSNQNIKDLALERSGNKTHITNTDQSEQRSTKKGCRRTEVSTSRLFYFVAALGFILIVCIVYTHMYTKDCIGFISISFLERAVTCMNFAIIFGIWLYIIYKIFLEDWYRRRSFFFETMIGSLKKRFYELRNEAIPIQTEFFKSKNRRLEESFQEGDYGPLELERPYSKERFRERIAHNKRMELEYLNLMKRLYEDAKKTEKIISKYEQLRRGLLCFATERPQYFQEGDYGQLEYKRPYSKERFRERIAHNKRMELEYLNLMKRLNRLNEVAKKTEKIISKYEQLRRGLVCFATERPQYLQEADYGQLEFKRPYSKEGLHPIGVPDIEIQRPRKLKDEFVDLREKEWTYALKSLQKTTQSEDMSIKMLLETLRDIYTSCCGYSYDEKEEVLQSLIPQSTGDNVAIKKLNKQHMMAEVCKQQNRSTTRAIEEIKEAVFDKNPELARNHLWTKYVERAVKICRLMSIQTKPMLLDFGPEQNADLNPSIFTTYKATGSKVNFVVWPAMFMQENRELLSKGIVEPIERNIQ
ncbi:uncharacterized protein LOC111111582 isoform X2 [Crassostrea virginica]